MTKKDILDRWTKYIQELFAGHALRGSCGDSHQLVLEGKINRKRGKGRPRMTWMRWIKVGSYADGLE